MVRARIRPDLILGGSFLLVLLLSLVLYALSRDPLARRTIFFPGTDSHLLSGEERLLPLRRGLEANVQLLVDEIILGPSQSEHRRLLPRKTQVLSLILRRGTLYLSLSHDILFPDEEGFGSVKDAVQAVGSTIRFNFPGLRRIYIFIDGQLPRFAEEEIGGSGAAGGEILYQKNLFR